MPAASFSFPKPTKPWCMCSSSEALERTRTKELSVFECFPQTHDPDPCSCLQKYRRSAAGGGVSINPTQVRSLDQLELSVDYLVGYIFPHQSNSRKIEPKSLCLTVNFMEDRIRAIQADLTTLLGRGKNFFPKTWRRVRNIEAKLIRYNILAQYLLSELNNEKVQWKFMNTALRTSISAYFATWDSVSGPVSDDELRVRDEIISYTGLMHIATVLKGREMALPPFSSRHAWFAFVCEDGEGMSALLGLYRRYIPKLANGSFDEAFMKQKYPKWTWLLNVANAAETGNFLKLLRLLAFEPVVNDINVSDRLVVSDELTNLNLPLDQESRWKILARCCMAQVLPIIRIGLLRIYNKSFGAKEMIACADLARLLHLPNKEIALSFCKTSGLPTKSSSDKYGGNDEYVIMKAAPISITGDESIKKMNNPGRNEDAFVFGSNASLWLEVEGIVENEGVVVVEDLGEEYVNGGGEEKEFWGNLKPRIDQDKVKILPSPIMWDLVG